MINILGKIYICGGFNGIECLDSVEFYDPSTNIWTLITPMLSRRSGIGTVSLNGFLYVVGGYDGMSRLSTCERYDPKGNKWTLIADMHSPRSNFGIEVQIIFSFYI
jgi:kelch-like protein 10